MNELFTNKHLIEQKKLSMRSIHFEFVTRTNLYLSRPKVTNSQTIFRSFLFQIIFIYISSLEYGAEY